MSDTPADELATAVADEVVAEVVDEEVDEQVLMVPPPEPVVNGGGQGKKRRWARVQAEEFPTNKYQRAESQQGEYNIWYHRYLGDQHHVRERATNRCVPERDSGMTRADTTRPDSYICLYFAKGCCVQGKKCNYLHRVPLPEDDSRLDMVHDIFGRKRHQTDREDMGGVGCFSKECKTLYIGNIPIDSIPETYKLLTKHFGAYGPIECINVKPKHGCCFIRFLYRANAEFAKIAMAEQPLDGEEQLNIRWAYEDPNPRVIKQIQNEKEQRVVDALRAKGYTQDMARYNAPAQYKPPDASSSQSRNLKDPYTYPDTAQQFANTPEMQLQEEYAKQYADQYAAYVQMYGVPPQEYAAGYTAPPSQPPPQKAAPPVVDKHTPMTREMYLAQQRK